MDYLKELYQRYQTYHFRRARDTFCYFQCCKTQGVISQSVIYCENGCLLYKDDEQNDIAQICEQQKYTENFFIPDQKQLKFNSNLVEEKCRLGMENMDRILKEWRAEEELNGKRTFVRDVKEFWEDPEKYENSQNTYYVDTRFQKEEPSKQH